MNRRLTLLRHAKSSWDDAAQSDRERPLNKRGLRDAPRMGQRFAEQRPIPAKIISSDAERAQETARIIASQFGYKADTVVTDSRLYLASARHILEVLESVGSGEQNLMVVGHNPGMTELANLIANVRIDNMPTCAALCIETDVQDWRELVTKPGNLVWYDYPKKTATGLSENTLI